jgi:hypothetical protein
MVELLEKPAVNTPNKKNERRRRLDRRERVASLMDFYRWLSALTLKISGLILVAILAMRWQRLPLQEAKPARAYAENTYRWHGFHRVPMNSVDGNYFSEQDAGAGAG